MQCGPSFLLSITLLSVFVLHGVGKTINDGKSLPVSTNNNLNAGDNNWKNDDSIHLKNEILYTGYDKKNVDTKIFNQPENLGLALHQVYEVLTSQLASLKSRVANVEEVAANILTKLTAVDCSDLKTKPSGLYTFNMNHAGKRPVTVRCEQDIDGGGWTVVQQRLPREKNTANLSTNFDQNWFDYKVGFGNPGSDYWVGLENLYIWTNTRHYELRIDLSDFQNDSSYAKYKKIVVDGEKEGYKLHVSDYSGTSGDSLTASGIPDNFTADGMMFSTKDKDNDSSDEINCSEYWKIGGWWFNRCSWANLNGPYLFPGEGDGTGINWHRWKNNQYLKSSIMMIRPIRIN